MTIREAIIKVMSATRRPLHYDEISEMIERKRLYRFRGEAPSQVVGSILYTNPDLFRKTEPGFFVLVRGTGRRMQPTRSARPAEVRRGGLLAAMLHVMEGAGSDMNYREIWDRIAAKRLFVTDAKAPWQTVGSYLYTRKDLFEQTGPGTFKLKGTNVSIRPANADGDGRSDGRQFESRTAGLLNRMGLRDVVVTPRSGDRGIDVWANHTTRQGSQLRVGVQTKYWNNASVGPGIVRELRGALDQDHIGLLVTTGKLTKEALRVPMVQPRPRLILIDGDHLTELERMAPARLLQYIGDLLG